MSDSMQKVEAPKPEPPSAPVIASSAPTDAAEAHFHQSLDELANSQAESQESIGVLVTVEAKFKKALDAFLEFMESLQLDQKMKKLVAELEPSFATFETRVLVPLNQFGQRASKEFESEIHTFQVEINQLKERITQRVAQIKAPAPSSSNDQPSAPSAPDAALTSSPPVAAIVAPSAPNAEPRAPNAMQDLLTLEAMGFTDRRKNLELLATHKGDMNAVVNALLG